MSHDHEHDESAHGAEPIQGVDSTALHALVDELSAALHSYVDTAVGVRAEFGATEADEDPRIAQFRELYRISEAKINTIFSGGHAEDDVLGTATADSNRPDSQPERVDAPAPPSKATTKPARKLADDYDDYDDDDEDADMPDSTESPLKAKSIPPSQDTTVGAPPALRLVPSGYEGKPRCSF